MTILRDKAVVRLSGIEAVLADSDTYVDCGDYLAAAGYAASARESADAAYVDFYDLAASLEEKGYGSCVEWYELAEYAAELGRIAEAACNDYCNYIKSSF